jgi:hypothetical protein
LAGVVFVSGALVGCTSAVTEPWEVTGAPGASGTGDGDSGATSSGSSSGGSGSSGSNGGGSSGGVPTGHDSGSPGNGNPDAGEPDSGNEDSSAPADAGVDSGPVTSGDGFGASRTACINKINALRATDTAVQLQPLTLENTDTVNTCVDTQATNDQSHNSGHYSFINNAPSCSWGSPQGLAQNECLQGYGTGVAGIEQCLQDMWDESLKPNCQGCIGCTAFGGACPNCDYSGSKGYECGHYVNMSAPYFTTVACGFAGSAPSSGDGWSVQNFE